MNSMELTNFSANVLTAAGADETEANVVAEILVWADMVGRPNQGVWRLPILCERLENGLYTSPCNIVIEKSSPSIGLADANNGLGHYAADYVMKKCITVAQDTGICIMTVKNSNFFGAAGYYAGLAAAENLIGIALSNSFPKVIPFKGNSPLLGTNPLAFACPVPNGSPLVLDMATSELAGSTVRKAVEQGSPAKHQIESFGGAKGYGLALLVEILSGLISGSGISHQVNSMYHDFLNPGNNGHFFLSIDIERFMPLDEYFSRMGALINFMNQSGDNVRYPGQQRLNSLHQSQASGIHLDKTTLSNLHSLAKKYNINHLSLS